jgi:hypothetical protein
VGAGVAIVAIAVVASGVFQSGGSSLAGVARPKQSGGSSVAGVARTSPTALPPATPAPIPTPLPYYGPGTITFGKGYDPTSVAIIGPATKFKASTRKIAWQASLTGPPGASFLQFIIAMRKAHGSEVNVYTAKIKITNEHTNVVAAASDLAALVDRKPGTYVVRLVRAGDLMAKGQFTLTK